MYWEFMYVHGDLGFSSILGGVWDRFRVRRGTIPPASMLECCRGDGWLISRCNRAMAGPPLPLQPTHCTDVHGGSDSCGCRTCMLHCSLSFPNGALPMSFFQAPPRYVRGQTEDVLRYLEWFEIGDCSLLRSEWERTAWLIRNVNREKVLEIHVLKKENAVRESATLGRIFDCDELDARGPYSMNSTTGLDWCVLKFVVGHRAFPAKLRDIITDVEAFSLDTITIVCPGARHRSVATAFALMLLAYPRALFVPYNEVVLPVARERLLEVPWGFVEYCRLLRRYVS